MIYDRTQFDVSQAQIIRKSLQAKLNALDQGFDVVLSSSDIEKLERGTCTVNMINRINNKQREVADLLNSVGFNIQITTENYTTENIFKKTQHDLLINNNKTLRNAISVFDTTPQNPTYIYRYNNANSIEKILVDLEDLINKMKHAFIHCGTRSSGQGGLIR